MLQRDGKASGDPAVLKRSFEGQLVQLQPWLAKQRTIAVLPVTYHRVVAAPRAVADELAAFLALPLDVAAMVAAVDPALHRQRGAATGAL